MCLEKIFPAVSVKAALAEVLALPVFALVVQEPVEVLNEGVMDISAFLNKQHVYPRHVQRLVAQAVDDYTCFPAEDIDG